MFQELFGVLEVERICETAPSSRGKTAHYLNASKIVARRQILRLRDTLRPISRPASYAASVMRPAS